MKRLIATLVAAFGVAGTLVPLGSVAYASPPVACFGTPAVPDTYVCLIRAQAGGGPCSDCGNPVVIPETCVGPCFGPFDLGRPGVDVYRGEVLVYYYKGRCYYVYGDGRKVDIPAADPPNCP